MIELHYSREEMCMGYSLSKLIVYFYRGLFSIVYFVIGKKKNIQKMLDYDNESEINMDTNNVFKNTISGVSSDEVKKVGFRYKAKNNLGKKINGTFDAYNIEQAKKFLASQGLTLTEIAPRGKYDIDVNIGKVLSTTDLSFALTQLATYIRAGIPLVDSVKILAKQSEKPSKKKVFDMIVYDLLSGDDFSAALSKQKKVFPKLLINMTRSAELTGDLPKVLDEMADYYTSIDKTKKEIKSAMTYPTVVFLFSIIVVAFVLIWVVPQYVSMFEGLNAELPPITVMTIKFSNFLQNYAVGLLLVIITILLLYIYLFRHVRSFKLAMQTLYMHLPVIKNIMIYSEVSMFSRTFASLLNHGVYITDSMDVLLNVSDNEIYRSIIKKTIANLNSGGKISDAFKDHWAFPLVAYEMIVTGESTGQLGTMMDKVANYYDSLHTNAVTSIKSLIEPVLIIFLAGSVGIILLAILLPMFRMYEVIQ